MKNEIKPKEDKAKKTEENELTEDSLGQISGGSISAPPKDYDLKKHGPWAGVNL